MGLYADGGGYNASGTAVAYSPEYAYNASNVFFQCASGLTPCANGTNDFAGVLGIPGEPRREPLPQRRLRWRGGLCL